MKSRHLLLILILILLLLITLGIPHQDEAWFQWFRSAGKEQEIHYTLLTEFRLPRMVMALVAGSGLAVCGLLLQTMLHNPLAGPSMLGLTSGSHLMVALTIMASGVLSGTLLDVSVTVASAIGSLAFGIIILLVAGRLRSPVSLLLVGILLGTFVSAITGILLAKSDPSALKAFTLWSFGSLQQVSFGQLPFVIIMGMLGIGATFFLVKPLNVLQLGERQATVLGVNIRRTQWTILVIVSLLTGLVTAFCGPIAFVGLIVPNVVRMLYRTTKHSTLLSGCILFGAILLLVCDLLVVILENTIVLPINAITSLLGAPIAILLLFKKVRNA